MTESVPASTKLTATELAEIRARKQATGSWPRDIIKADGTYEIFLESCELRMRRIYDPRKAEAPKEEPAP